MSDVNSQPSAWVNVLSFATDFEELKASVGVDGSFRALCFWCTYSDIYIDSAMHQYEVWTHLVSFASLTSKYQMPAGVQTALQGLSSSHWEVRNSASLCFSALSVRILGFKNQQMTSSVSSTQLFLQYPSLHATLVEHLQETVRQLQCDTKSLHPVLLPILALLARLRYMPSLKEERKKRLQAAVVL